LRYELATAADDPEVRRLLRANPMGGAVRLSLCCEPDASLASRLAGDLHQVIVARDAATGRLRGMASRSVGEAWVDGEPARLGYLGQLRVDAPFRGRPRLVTAGFRRLRELHADGAAPFYVTTIVADNRVARRLLESGRPPLPVYQPREELSNLALSPGRRRRPARGDRALAVEPGRSETLDEVAACLGRWGRRHQFAPRWSRAGLEGGPRTRGLAPEDFLVARRRGECVGCVALWDQGAFKQVVVHGYGRGLGLARPLANLVAPLARWPRLPRPGEALRQAFLSHLAVDGDDPDVAAALVDAALEAARRRGFAVATLGLARRHPLRAALRARYPARDYPAVLYLVHWPEDAERARAVDDRVPHLEVAVL